LLKNDRWIIEEGIKHIDPFSLGIKRPGVISYGVSSFGYDIRVGNEFWVAKNEAGILDPKNFDDNLFYKLVVDEFVVLPPHGFALAKSVEYVSIPRDITGLCVGKSTYARTGLVLNTTPIEAEWEGYITLELSNTTPFFLKVYANEGIGQLLFLTGNAPCLTSYADKDGKYQGQTEITPSKVD
jgi:dCTP deaminase